MTLPTSAAAFERHPFLRRFRERLLGDPASPDKDLFTGKIYDLDKHMRAQRICEMNNRIARKIMGWHTTVEPSLEACLPWLDASGKRVMFLWREHTQMWLCTSPWVKGGPEDFVVFNPAGRCDRDLPGIDLLLAQCQSSGVDVSLGKDGRLRARHRGRWIRTPLGDASVDRLRILPACWLIERAWDLAHLSG